MSSGNDDISEQAQAKKGNWKGSKELLGEISETVINLYYKKIDEVEINSESYILLHNTSHKPHIVYSLGYWIDVEESTKLGLEKNKKFKIVFGISLLKNKVSKIYGDLYTVKGVGVEDFGTGLSRYMYKYFVKKLRYTIVGDGEQYFGARKLWAKLSKQVDVEVDLYNIETDTLIEENVILHHGNYNNDFDKRLWSFIKEKINIRSILKDIL